MFTGVTICLRRQVDVAQPVGMTQARFFSVMRRIIYMHDITQVKFS